MLDNSIAQVNTGFGVYEMASNLAEQQGILYVVAKCGLDRNQPRRNAGLNSPVAHLSRRCPLTQRSAGCCWRCRSHSGSPFWFRFASE
jgi:hypothetical protein